jgi:organic radical activating enzyme
MGLAVSNNRQIELFVDLGRACNLKCGHCINSSGPSIKVENINDLEIQNLVETINSNLAISTVHFSGGEPILYRDSIASIQKLVTRDVNYAITTNGSIGDQILQWLGELKIDHFNVSVDRWHQAFVSDEVIKRFVSSLKEKKVTISISIVVDKLYEMANFDWCIDLGVELLPRFREKSGRSKESSDDHMLSSLGVCPSLEYPVKKVNWIRGKGYSYCCGPLIFDDLCSNSKLAVKNFEDLDGCEISQSLQFGSFDERMKAIGWRNKNFKTICEACSVLHKERPKLNFKSYLDLLISNERYFALDKEVDREDWASLIGNYRLSYLFVKENAGIVPLELIDSSEHKTSIHPIREFGQDGMLEFVKENYFDNWTEYRPASDFDSFAKATPAFYAKDLRGFWYLKNNIKGGMIVVAPEKDHAFLKRSVLHIGYWGYDRQLLTKNESKQVKSHWTMFLNLQSKKEGNIPITAVIDAFNSPSINFAKNLGFKIVAGRLDAIE